ncbi:MAG TPA: HlyD family type I secretion periplasmic adaptor subunit [Gammaproteobacteria bacterium]|nr:HlyD family type I secretion periplasmic adaptor subunit [Gammaproteobacteria bacterium]
MKNRHEYEFLPAALEVQETPPSPIGRFIIWTLLSLTVIAIVWAIVGQVDIVATAQGKIIPGGRDKIIQPLEIGVVRKIHVQEGQHVEKGDLLVELDATASGADETRMRHELIHARFEAARLRALIDDGDHDATAFGDGELAALKVSAPEIFAMQARLLQSERHEHAARKAVLENDIRKLRAERAVTQNILSKLQATLPLVSERAQALRDMAEANLGPRQQYLEVEQQRLEQQHDIVTQKSRLEEIAVAIATAKQQLESYEAERERTILTQLAESESKINTLDNEFKKARQRHRQQHLEAPVSGTVQELVIHTEGGVVTPAQALMVIVPRESVLEVEAWIANKDIGFVNEGQTAEVKIEAFPFTKYGVIDAELLDISSNAISDEKLGLVYRAQVLLKASKILVKDKWVNLSPGMAVTVEVKTGKRRLVEYFLSPLLKYTDESIRER